MTGDKFRFRFTKTGPLRLLSHHDLMRCFERMLRRADLPFKSTAGFHPAPRVVFALSLPLGVAGLDEVVEIEFLRTLESDDVLGRLQAQAPAGLVFTRISVVPMKATARPRRAVFQLELPLDDAQPTAARCAALLAEKTIWVERLNPAPKRLNIRPYLRRLTVQTHFPRVAPEREIGGESPCPFGGAIEEIASLTIDLWVTQTGTARVDEVLKQLDLADRADGAIIERITVELRDEASAADPTDQPPDGPADTLPLDPAAIAALTRRDEEQRTAAAWGVMPAGAVVE